MFGSIKTSNFAKSATKRLLEPMLRNPVTLLGFAIILVFIGIATAAPWLSPHDPNLVDLANRLTGPSPANLFGTDQFGRDILSRLITGSRVSLIVGVIATALAGLAGILLGALAAWWGGGADNLIMRVMDVVLAFPAIVVAVALAAVFGAGLDKVIIIISITRVPEFARVARSAVLTYREVDFVGAAKALGQSNLVILLRHVLPNCLAPLIVYASFSIATAINTEAALSFLGLGIQPPQASWGTMLGDARTYMLLSPWIAVFPGIAITLTVSAFNLVGDGLRDLADPRLRGALRG